MQRPAALGGRGQQPDASARLQCWPRLQRWLQRCAHQEGVCSIILIGGREGDVGGRVPVLGEDHQVLLRRRRTRGS